MGDLTRAVNSIAAIKSTIDLLRCSSASFGIDIGLESLVLRLQNHEAHVPLANIEAFPTIWQLL